MNSLEDVALHRCPRERSIELDCPPGSPRPGDLIEGVIEGLGLPWPKETTSMFFGNWKWEWPEVDWKRWKEIQPTLKGRIKKLYEQGLIRYGSW